MDTETRREREFEAGRRLRAQARRVRRLRGRVVATALASFALLWGVVFAQMATGNDPALSDSSSSGAGTSAKQAVASQPVEAEATETEAIEPETVESEVFETEAVQAEPEPAPVMTGQS